MKKKALCDFSKSDIEKHKKKLKKMIVDPKYICKKCFRACSNKDYLCKPLKF